MTENSVWESVQYRVLFCVYSLTSACLPRAKHRKWKNHGWKWEIIFEFTQSGDCPPTASFSKTVFLEIVSIQCTINSICLLSFGVHFFVHVFTQCYLLSWLSKLSKSTTPCLPLSQQRRVYSYSPGFYNVHCMCTIIYVIISFPVSLSPLSFVSLYHTIPYHTILYQRKGC